VRLPHQWPESIQNPHSQWDVEADELQETGTQSGLEDHSGHDWYRELVRALQSEPKLVASFDHRQEYQYHQSLKTQSALDEYNALNDRVERELSAQVIAMEGLPSLSRGKDAEHNPDPAREILEPANYHRKSP